MSEHSSPQSPGLAVHTTLLPIHLIRSLQSVQTRFSIISQEDAASDPDRRTCERPGCRRRRNTVTTALDKERHRQSSFPCFRTRPYHPTCPSTMMTEDELREAREASVVRDTSSRSLSVNRLKPRPLVGSSRRRLFRPWETYLNQLSHSSIPCYETPLATDWWAMDSTVGKSNNTGTSRPEQDESCGGADQFTISGDFTLQECQPVHRVRQRQRNDGITP